MLANTNYTKHIKNAISLYQHWKVSFIPVIFKSKKPLAHWKQYQKRLPETNEIDTWCKQHWSKEANIGIICGKVSGNFVVLDFDNDPSYQDFIKRCLSYDIDIVATTPVVKTRKGFHVYLRTKSLTKSLKLKDLDIKSEGGYVVSPPSIHSTGIQYEFINPDCLNTILEIDSLTELGIQTKSVNTPKQIKDTWVIKALQGVPEGERDNTCIKLAGHFKKKGLDSTETLAILKIFATKCTPPFPEAQVEKCVKSSYSYESKGESQKPTNRAEYIAKTTEWLYIKDIEALDILMASAISVRFPGDPIWLFVIAPPGGTKTELIRAFIGQHVYTLSSFTPQTFISGLKSKNGIDLLPKLNKKVLIIKDFTSILSKKAEDQAAIFADLREAYDGYLEKSFGSGVVKKSYQSHFGLIAAVTGAIDMYRVVHSALGERFLKIRLQSDAEAAISKAGEMAGKEEKMRKILSGVTEKCLSYYIRRIAEFSSPAIEDPIRKKIESLGNLTAILRSEVARDRMHKVLYKPEIEIGTRLTKQLLKMGQALAVFYEHDSVGNNEYQRLLRVAFDTIPRQRMPIVSAMIGMEELSTKGIADKANMPTDTAREFLEDLWMLGIIERLGKEQFKWKLAKKTQELLTKSELLKKDLKIE